MAVETKGGLPVRAFATVGAFERWLERHVGDAGLWVKIAKVGGAGRSISYGEALDAAICFGWIDGHKVGYDDDWWLQRFTPRRPTGRWSLINCGKADALIAAGRMRPAGQAEVDAARADGRWDAAYEPQSRATVPDDLQQALDQNPAAAEFFATLTGVRRYAFLYRLHNVRAPFKRAQRIAHYIVILSERRTLN